MADAAGKEGINLFALSLDQLNQLKQSIEEELQGLNGAIQQLQVSRNKLTTSKDALNRLAATPESTPMLVPITSSLYVPGETAQLDTILVDVGTGAKRAPHTSTPKRSTRSLASPFLACSFCCCCCCCCALSARLAMCCAVAGYFIEKSMDEAIAFLTRKMALIESQATNVQSAAQFKNQNLQQTVDVMNRKIMEMRAGGAGGSGGGGGGGGGGTAV